MTEQLPVPASRPALTPERRLAFLESLSLYGNVRLAARAGEVSPQTAYRARHADEGFALAWDAALAKARTHVEAVLADRAINGVEEAVFYHGEEVARRTRFDSRLLLALLARLDKHADRMEAEAARPAPSEREVREDIGADIYAEDPETMPELERRLQAMEAARPASAPPFRSYEDRYEVEMLQLFAFEHGAEKWWEIASLDDLPTSLIEKIDQTGVD